MHQHPCRDGVQGCPGAVAGTRVQHLDEGPEQALLGQACQERAHQQLSNSVMKGITCFTKSSNLK